MKQRSLELHTYVMWALKKRKLTPIILRKLILSYSPVNIDVRDASGFTMLFLVISHSPDSHMALAKELLVKHGANPNIGDIDGMTPLMSAAANGCTPMVKLLLANKAATGLHLKGLHREGWQPLLGEDRESWKVSKMSQRFGSALTALEWATSYGQDHVVRLLAKSKY
jgi:ankyrin repeat protein